MDQGITSSKSDIVDIQYTEKIVSPRIEPCGTPIESARGLDDRRFYTLNSNCEVVGEPGKAVISETKAI